MRPKLIGYARVSTDDQNLELQLQALKAAHCDTIFKDHGVSGAQRSRPGLDQALHALRPGDKLVVWRLDRLGRSLVNLIQLLDDLCREGIMFSSLCENVDTTSSGGRLVFHMIAALAEFERSLISERTRAGMAAAKAVGKHVGRPPLLTPEQSLEASYLMDAGVSPRLVAKKFNVHPRTLKRHLMQLDEPETPEVPH